MSEQEELEIEIMKLETAKIIFEAEMIKTEVKVLNQVYNNTLSFKDEILKEKDQRINDFRII